MRSFLFFCLSLTFHLPLAKAQKSFGVGDTLPNFSYPGQFTKSYQLNELKGSYVLIHCWASWNEESRKMQMEFIDPFIRFKDKRFKSGKRFQIISISLDHDKALWELALKKDNLPWKMQVCDTKGWESPLINLLDISVIPKNYLIDPRGIILKINVTPEELLQTLKSF